MDVTVTLPCNANILLALINTMEVETEPAGATGGSGITHPLLCYSTGSEHEINLWQMTYYIY